MPKLRFPGFEGEWEEKTFSEIADGFDYGINAAAVEFNGKHKYIRITDIDDTSHKFIGNPCVSPSGEIEEKYKVQIGDILLARTGASVGKSYLYDVCDGELYFAGFLIRARVNPKYDPRFIFYITCTPTYARWVGLISMRSGQPGINAEEYSQYKLFIPEGKERAKISDFLSLLDSRIAAQRKLVEFLKKHKRGLLREVFEENNEGDYRPFSEIAKRRNDKIAPMPDSTLKCIELEHIEPETGRIIGSVPLKRQTSLKNFCRPDDIIFGKLRPYLRKFAFAEDDSAASSETWVLVAVKDILPRFLFYLIQSEPFMRAASVSSGTKMPRSEWSNVAGARFRIPDERRQCIIAESFSLFDKRIQESQLIAEAMERVKRGLLQALFV